MIERYAGRIVTLCAVNFNTSFLRPLSHRAVSLPARFARSRVKSRFAPFATGAQGVGCAFAFLFGVLSAAGRGQTIRKINAGSPIPRAVRNRSFLQDVATPTTCLDGLPSEKVFALARTTKGALYAGTSAGLARCDERVNRWRRVADPTLARAAIRSLRAEPDGGLWVVTMQESCHFRPGRPPRFEKLSAASRARLSRPPAALVRDGNGGRWTTSGRGLIHYTENAARFITGANGLPLVAPAHLARNRNGALWAGGKTGLARLWQGRWRYYASRRWLPDNRVNALCADDGRGDGKPGSVWVATDRGVARIAFRPLTLARKAAWYERATQARHNRRGFVGACLLPTPGDTSRWLPEVSDNDGLWTSLYVCAESFRYAATRDPQARRRARESMRALLGLLDVTGIPGFPARALVYDGERAFRTGPAANWYRSPRDPRVRYKAETSADEIDGHYLAWYVYSQLVANRREKLEIARACRQVTTHILNHNYTLVGPNGKPTRWGVWTPDKLNNDPDWRAERGLNSLALLSHLRVALRLCPSARFASAYRTLVTRHHYALNTVEQKIMPPFGDNNHSDDQLAAIAYYPLLRLETDPGLRALYRQSLERTQAILRPERSPFYNFLYAALTGRTEDVAPGVRWLEDAPLDLRDWTISNRARADVAFDATAGRQQEAQLTRVLPPNETRIGRWNRNPYEAEGGTGGRREADGAFWLLPYWMARYHRLL